jgi:fucose permease
VTSRSAQATTVYLSSFVQGLAGVAYPASASVLRARGLTDAQYGSLFVPQVTLAALGAATGGLVVERIGAKRALALGFVFMALSQAALAAVLASPAGWVFPLAFLGTSLLGLGAGVSAGPLNAYPQVLFPERSESAVVALHATVGVGLALTPVLAGGALARGHWLAVPLLLLAVNAALFVAVEREDLPEPEPRPHGESVPRPRGDAVLRLLVGVAFLYGITESVYGNWAVPYLTEERGLGVAAAGLALAAFWAALTAGRFAVAAVVFRVSPASVLPVLGAAMAGACLLVPLATTPLRAVLLYALGGLGCSAVFPLTVGVAGRRFPAHRSWVSSATYAALCAGIGVGSFSAGLLRSGIDLGSVYRLAAVPATLALALALRAGRQGVRS